MPRKKKHWSDILTYTGKRQQNTVRKYYLEYRSEMKLPIRCDISECKFYTEPLEWNGKALNLILDHVDGAYGNNYPNNLRLICPNCNTQQPTYAGGNKGKVILMEHIYAFYDKASGKKQYIAPVQPLKVEIKTFDIAITKSITSMSD